MERLTDMDVGIDKYFSFVVLKSPIVKAHMPLTSLFPIDKGCVVLNMRRKHLSAGNRPEPTRHPVEDHRARWGRASAPTRRAIANRGAAASLTLAGMISSTFLPPYITTISSQIASTTDQIVTDKDVGRVRGRVAGP